MELPNTNAAAQTPTVLVVDDNATARYSIARMLRAAGFNTVETAGGAEALELAQKGVSAVVLDVHLPDLHGFEVCRLLRSQASTATLPVIHVSAVHVKPEDQASGLRTGADAYLLSPVEPPVLVATLEALIRSRVYEGEVRLSEYRFRGIFEKVDCAIALVGEGHFVEVNAAFAALIGQSVEQLRGRRLSSLAPVRWTVSVEQILAGWGKSWRGEFPLRGVDGAPVPLKWTVTPHVEAGFSIAVAMPA